VAAQLRRLPPAGGAPGEAADPRAPPLPRRPRSLSAPPFSVLYLSIVLVLVSGRR
jgi:hypothetical protein